MHLCTFRPLTDVEAAHFQSLLQLSDFDSLPTTSKLTLSLLAPAITFRQNMRPKMSTCYLGRGAIVKIPISSIRQHSWDQQRLLLRGGATLPPQDLVVT